MSNKTQLSNNNTQLASLIQELANKAAGGGSGAVETCTVTITNDRPGTYWFQAGYQTENGVATVEDDGETTLYTIECIAPSVMFLHIPSNVPTLAGGLEIAVDGGYSHAVYITGDGSISIV